MMMPRVRGDERQESVRQDEIHAVVALSPSMGRNGHRRLEPPRNSVRLTQHHHS